MYCTICTMLIMHASICKHVQIYAIFMCTLICLYAMSIYLWEVPSRTTPLLFQLIRCQRCASPKWLEMVRLLKGSCFPTESGFPVPDRENFSYWCLQYLITILAESNTRQLLFWVRNSQEPTLGFLGLCLVFLLDFNVLTRFLHSVPVQHQAVSKLQSKLRAPNTWPVCGDTWLCVDMMPCIVHVDVWVHGCSCG